MDWNEGIMGNTIKKLNAKSVNYIPLFQYSIVPQACPN
jgi:hypothetical protein